MKNAVLSNENNEIMSMSGFFLMIQKASHWDSVWSGLFVLNMTSEAVCEKDGRGSETLRRH